MSKIHLVKGPPLEVLIEDQAKRKMLKETAKKACPEYGKEIRGRARELATAHHRNAIEQVRMVLSGENAPPARTAPGTYATRPARSYKISIGGAGKRRHVITTLPWKALNEAYAASHPANVTFWHKTGLLFRLFRHLGLKKATVKPVKVSYSDNPAGTVKAGTSKKGKPLLVCHSLAKLDFQPMPYPFQTVFTQSFLSGEALREGVEPPAGFDRKGLARGYYPEHFRPVISQIAATLGSAMYEKLRKLK